jgi:hypothetical protein
MAVSVPAPNERGLTMAHRIVTAAGADRTPNWNKWRSTPELTPSQCAALWTNIDPDKLRYDGFKEFMKSQEFKDRLDMVRANLYRALKAKNGKVDLCLFAAWVGELREGWDAPAELLAMADEEVPIKADRAPSEERARMPYMDLSHSKFIPLSVLHRALDRDKYLIEIALHILSVEDPESTHTEAGAVSELLNHWLVNRELGYYINGQRGDDFTALTVIPVNGDYGRGLAALETWITIDKEELV